MHQKRAASGLATVIATAVAAGAHVWPSEDPCMTAEALLQQARYEHFLQIDARAINANFLVQGADLLNQMVQERSGDIYPAYEIVIDSADMYMRQVMQHSLTRDSLIFTSEPYVQQCLETRMRDQHE